MDAHSGDETPNPEHTTDDQHRTSIDGEDVAGFARGAIGPVVSPGLLELPLTIPPIRFHPEPDPWKRLDPEPNPWKEAGEAISGPIGL